LKKTGAITKQRNNVARKIHQQLSPYHPKLLTLPQLHVKNQLSNWHIFPVLVDKRKRPQILASLNKKGIHAAFHLLPLHLSQYAKKYLHYKKGDLPVTEHVSTSLIRLPIFPQMTDKEIKWMTQEIGKTVQWLT
jgi:dTDP-4-amino-4,6-dideoxygalactose transaminase